MFIEKLIETNDMENYLSNLTDDEKKILFSEIEEQKKSNEAEVIRLETMKKKLEEDRAIQLQELTNLNINSVAELQTEISKLDSEINSELKKYVEILKGAE